MAPPDFTQTFERLWITFRARWCDCTDLGGALAFHHHRIKITTYHRVVQINVDENRSDGLIDEALHFFQEKQFSCAFTLSPLDRPEDFANRLERRGFSFATLASVMDCEQLAEPPKIGAIEIEKVSTNRYGRWADVVCRGFGLPPEVGQLGASVLNTSDVQLYLAHTDGEPAGAALLFSHNDMGYVDLVATLPEHRRKGVASALVAHLVTHSQALGNRWTALEVQTETPAERIYERLGFRTIYHRPRYIR
jgi:ribosomal protein S18 acetylase RimI-like enzyme